MRVIAGTARSLPLKTPKGPDTRPTTDRIKETLFNMLSPHILGSIFIDAFSGSGGIGIEALSRGAEKAYFIDKEAASIACIRENLGFTKLEERAIVIRQDVLSALMGISEKHVDIVFMDPPYDIGADREILEVLPKLEYVDSHTTFILEASLKADFSYVSKMGISVIKEKKYKSNKHVFLQINN